MPKRREESLTEKRIRDLQPSGRRYEVADGMVPGLHVRVNTSGHKTYCIVYGRGKRLTLGDAATMTLAQARDLAKGAMHQARTGKDPILEQRKAKTAEFIAYLDEVYKPHALARLRTGKETVAIIRSVFGPLFRGKELGEITAAMVERWRDRRLSEGAKPATVNRNVGRLKAMLSLAVKYGDLDRNPLAGMSAIPTDNARVRFLSPQEEEALRIALDERQEEMRSKRDSYNAWRKARHLPPLALHQAAFTDYLKPMVLLAMNTGMRRGELLKLTWQDVDMAEGIITITPASAKTGKRRHIPLSDEAQWVLGELQKQAHGTFVFHKDGKPLASVDTSWETVLQRAGIADFKFHDLRHHFASRLVQLGADLNTVRELLGHGDLTMTLRYAHLAPHNRRKAIALLNKPREAEGVVLPFRR